MSANSIFPDSRLVVSCALRLDYMVVDPNSLSTTKSRGWLGCGGKHLTQLCWEVGIVIDANSDYHSPDDFWLSGFVDHRRWPISVWIR